MAGKAAFQGSPCAHGGAVTQGTDKVKVNRQNAAHAGHMHTCTQYGHTPLHVSEGSLSVRYVGIPAARVGDRALCLAKGLAPSEVWVPPAGFTPGELLAMQCVAPDEPTELTNNDAPVRKKEWAEATPVDQGPDADTNARAGMSIEAGNERAGADLDLATGEVTYGDRGATANVDVFSNTYRGQLEGGGATIGVEAGYEIGSVEARARRLAGTEGLAGDSDRYWGAELDIGGGADAIKGSLAGFVEIPIPFTDLSFKARIAKDASVGKSLGVKAGAYMDRYTNRAHSYGKVPKLGSVEFSFGDRLTPEEKAAIAAAQGFVDALLTQTAADPITLGSPDVEIGD